MPALQTFARQAKEDGADPSAKWGKDLPAPAVPEVEDPDDEDQLPIPAAGGPTSGKPRARASIRDWSDDDDDECEVLEVLEVRPIAFAYPLPSAPADPGGQVPSTRPATTGNRGVSRKRAGTGTSDTGTSRAPDPAAKKPKLQKKSANKPRGKKMPPVTQG